LKFGLLLRFARAHHKISCRRKVGVAWASGAPQNFKVPFNIYVIAEASILVRSMGWSRPITKLHPQEIVGVALV